MIYYQNNKTDSYMAPQGLWSIKAHGIPNTPLKSSRHPPKYDLSTSPHLTNQFRQSCDILGLVPELYELPSLDNDSLFDVRSCESYNGRRAKPKRHISVKFIDAADQHPLAIREFISTKLPSYTRTAPPSKSVPPTKPQKSRSALVTASSCMRDEEIAELRNFNKSTQELVEYNRRVQPFSLQPTKRFLRPNASYLRMFVAEKHMYLSGKLNRLKCDPYMRPRTDNVGTEPAKILDIAYKWNKKPRTRDWVQLN